MAPVDDGDRPPHRRSPGAGSGPAPGTSGDPAPAAGAGEDDTERESPAAGSPPRGADIARAALEAARATRAARGAPAPRRTTRAAVGGERRRRRGWSGPGSDDRDPQPLGRAAARLSTRLGWSSRLASGSVFGRWAELVGADVAEHARPVSLHEGVLTVAADSTAWATQLRLLQRELLRRIAAGLGHGVVTSMRIHGPSAPSWRRGPRHVSGRGPRDTYG